MVLEIDGKGYNSIHSDNVDTSTSHSNEGLFSQMLTYEKQAFADVLAGKGTVGEYAATAVPLVAAGLLTDGLGLTSFVSKASPVVADAGGVATQVINRVGLGSIGAVTATGILGARQYLMNQQFPFLRKAGSE
jgi:hypothetical protein